MNIYRTLSWVLPFIALSVIVLGAYVRLTDAGLGCPDWPGCYGHIGVPTSDQAIADANSKYSERPVEVGKAWREMVHRYLAAFLGLGIVVLAAFALRNNGPRRQLWLPVGLVALVCFQGALGMWTVTLLLKPLVVVAHLLGGLAVLSLLWWHLLRVHYPAAEDASQQQPNPWITVALVALLLQIFLGGWTSTNYAALACTDFPTCHGRYWPDMDFAEAFTLWRGLGIDYEYGVLETPARTAIHYSHRLWAVVTASLLLVAVFQGITRGSAAVRASAWCIIVLLGVQLFLGITNVLKGLPLPVAVGHNGGAALLLVATLTLKYFDKHKAH